MSRPTAAQILCTLALLGMTLPDERVTDASVEVLPPAAGVPRDPLARRQRRRLRKERPAQRGRRP